MSKDDKEKLDSEGKKSKKKSQDINPFAALFGLGKEKEKKKKSEEDVVLAPEDIKKDNFIEKTMRADAAKDAANWLYLAYDIYKKAHQMASAPGEGFDTHDADVVEELSEGGNVGFSKAFKGKESN